MSIPLNIQKGKPNRGAVYMGTCAGCGKRKRISQDLYGQWYFACSCGAARVHIGPTARLESLISEVQK